MYLHGTAAELVIQLGAKDSRGPDLILSGVSALPVKEGQKINPFISLIQLVINMDNYKYALSLLAGVLELFFP